MKALSHYTGCSGWDPKLASLLGTKVRGATAWASLICLIAVLIGHVMLGRFNYRLLWQVKHVQSRRHWRRMYGRAKWQCRTLCFLGNKENVPANFKSPVWKVQGIATNVQPDYFLNCYDMTVVGIVTSLLAGRSRDSNLSRRKNLFSITSRPTVRPSQPSIQRIPGFFSEDTAAAAWNWLLLCI